MARPRGHVPVVTTEDQISPIGCRGRPGRAVRRGGRSGRRPRAAMARSCARRGWSPAIGRPVLGINLGQLGFLAMFAPRRPRQAISAATRGELAARVRTRLAVTFLPRRREPIVRYALNDAVLHQGAMARLDRCRSVLRWPVDRRVSRRRSDHRDADRIDRLQHGRGRTDRRARPGGDDDHADLRARADQPAARDRRALDLEDAARRRCARRDPHGRRPVGHARSCPAIPSR